jgi:hypothetical protein
LPLQIFRDLPGGNTGCQPARIFLFLFVFLLPTIALRADTHTAPNCSQADVQAAIDAAVDGDIVQVPPGTCTWTTAATIGMQLTWGENPTFESKQIELRGAGIDNTTIVSASSYGGTLLNIIGVEGKLIRITGFTFKGVKRLSTTFPAISLSARIWRIDHCKFDSSDITPWQQGRGIMVSGKGIIDHCDFLNSYQSISITGDGDASWNRLLTPGTADAVYIEACIITNTQPFDGATDAYNGARWVFRHNKIINEIVSCHGRDTGGYRSPLWFEYYDNTFTYTLPDDYFASANFRGGTGVIFNNSWTGKYRGNIRLVYYCANPSGASCGWPLCTTYPCIDQTGRGPDMDHDGVQDPAPLYEWNNTKNGGNMSIDVETFSAPFIQDGRDYYSDKYNPKYIPYPYPHPMTLGDYPGQQRSLDLIATPSSGQINLSWKAVTGAVSYSILRNWLQVALVTGIIWSDSAPGSAPVYMVYALDGTGKILAAEGKLVDNSNIEQILSLTSGWNWISFNVLPADLSLNSIFNGIMSQVEQVKAQTQSVIRNAGAWKGDLANMNGIGQYKMFKIKVSAACTLTVTGTAIASATPIPLVSGWNWVAYLPTTSMPIVTALDSIKGQVQEVKSLTQSATYNGTSWSGILTQLKPGQGYAIKMSAAGTLTYPAAVN